MQIESRAVGARAPRAVVSGGTGFIGSALCAALANQGWDVHVLSRRAGVSHLARLHALDRQATGLLPLLDQIRPDVVFHLATLFLAEHRPDQIDDLIDANLRLGTHLLEAMRHAGVRRLVNAATSWQHAEPDSGDYRPANLYAATKQAFEAIVDYHCQVHGLAALSLTLFDSYGPGDFRPKLLNLLLGLRDDSPPLAVSPGEQQLALVHSRDVATALLRSEQLLSNHAEPGHLRYVLGGVEPRSLRDIVRLLESLRGRALPVVWGGRPYRTREIMQPWRRGEPLPGWRPEVELRDGLAELLLQPAPP